MENIILIFSVLVVFGGIAYIVKDVLKHFSKIQTER